MTRSTVVIVVLLVAAGVGWAEEPTLQFGRFGTVHLYKPAGPPKAVALFVSGDGAWNAGVIDMAQDLQELGVLVVGIDIIHYLGQLATSTEKCSYPAADFEGLSQYIQKKLDFPAYISPVLVGYSSGATLVYAVLVQAPPNTFKGAISLGFCPDLPLVRPMCRGNGLEWTAGPKGKGVNFLPASTLSAPWVALQGTIDQVCDPKQTEDFVARTPGGEVVVLPKVGHGYSVPRNWLPQLREVFRKMTAAPEIPSPAAPTGGAAAAPVASPPAAAVADLPLVEVAAAKPGDTLAVFLSGDGGWAGIDREVGGALAREGVAVVGLDSLRYFWSKRTPEQTAADVARVARHYLETLKRGKLLLAGYSRGADVLPFVANRLPEDLRARLVGVAMLGPSHRAEFEFHVSDWLGGGGDAGLPTAPEANRLTEIGVPVLCFFGEDEADALCRDLRLPVTVVRMPEGHHFGGKYQEMAGRILAALAPPAQVSTGSPQG